MATKSAFVESLDPNVILSGDIIGMQVDTLGLMCIPSSREPIPEKEEQVSHLRIDTSHKKSSNADYRRCMFKVENDSGERTNIVFGSTVKISHYPTGLVVIGSSVNDEGYKESKMRCVFLSSSESLPTDSLVHKWIVGPRYKLREEGDPVRHNDYVVLRNAQYKQLYLTSFPVRKHDDSEHLTFSDHLLGLGPASFVTAKPGINIMLLRKGTGMQPDEVNGAVPTGDSVESIENLVISSDYIRVMHREYRGHLIARTDDETELQSSVMPLGSTTRKRGNQALDHTMGVFLRAFADQQPREQLDFPAAYCSQGVWQVLSTESAQESASMHSAVKFGTSIRLRHLITGQYLSVRPLEDNDTQKLKEYSSFCIPKQTKHIDNSTKSMTPTNRDRSRAIASANSGHHHRGELLPAALAESLRKEKLLSVSGKKNSVQINGQDVEIQDPADLDIKTVDLCVVAILADGLHSSDWTGKHRNSVHMNFSADKGIWEFRTGRSDVPGNLCGWEVDKLNPSAHFKVSEDELKTDFLQVTVYREHMVSGRTAIGTGMAQVSSLVSEFEPGETFDVVVALTDPSSGGPGGTVTVRFCANTLLSKSEYNQLLINTEQAGLSPDRIAAFSSPVSEFLDDDSTASEETESEEQGTQDQMMGDMLDGTLKMSHADISTTNWVVGTSSAPDKYTKFNILVVDRKLGDDDFVSYNERFVLEHSYTRQRLKLSTLLGMDSQTTWWEYKSDIALVPSPFRDGAIIDSEVCQFDRVDLAEIKDILFAARFMQLARAATTAMQLTPRPSQLYMPLFRHFHNSLLTLTLWTLGVTNSDSALCAETTTHEDVKKHQRSAGFMKKLAHKLGNASEKLLNVVASPERLLQAGSDRVHQGMAMLGLDHNHSHSPHPDAAEDVDSDDESYFDDSEEGEGEGEDIDTDSEDQDDDLMGDGDDGDGGWSQAIGLQMGMLTPPTSNTKYSALETSGHRNKKRRNGNKKSDVAPATAEIAAPRHSSLAPWVGRKVPRPVTSNLPTAGKNGRTPGRSARTPAPLPELLETPLLKYANEKLDDFVYKDLPINEVLLRRQSILSDSALLDQIVHFLNVLFQLQRAVTLTHDPRMKEQYSCLPQFLLACSAQINKLISACVFKNEKVALKLISVQGSFLAMISQKIQGWDPPIEAILHQTCRNVTKQIPYGSIGPLNSQNDSLLGSSMHKDVGDDSTEHEKDGGEESETLTPLGSKADAFNIEPILMDAISASDVRQVVEQMHEVHLKRDPSALKILGMLTLLCSSGTAKKYFQNLLVNAIAIQNHEDFSLSGDFVQSQRATSLQTNCVLFFTQFANKQWEVKFNNPFSFPSQQSKNQEHQRAKLTREGSSLNKLFAHYNSDDNSVLDISECFELLEDLGLGGPFLYKEIRYLESSTIWGFASWWCYRSSFYYPASSISQCQLSPVQAIQVMGEKMTPALMELEMRRTMVSEQAVARELDPLELLNERIAGLCLSYEEGFERDKGGLSIVEDYVRSLGGPDTTTNNHNTSSAFDYFNTAGDDLFESGQSTGGSAHTTKNRFSNTFLSARNNQPNSRHSPSTHFQLDPINTGASHDWVEFGSALEDGFEDAAWFRMSLTLLAEICKDRNAYTQRIVGSILPAECLMAVLEADSVHYEEKAVLCKLLSNIYVDHRLVFPTRFSPFNTDIVYLGYREEILNPAITMGKLFNAQSRTRFLGPGSEDGSALRQRLFRHLAHKIKDVQLVSRSRAIISYYSAMLGLFKLLVLKGFLQEPEFGFVTSNQTSDDFADEGSNHNFYTNKTSSTQVVFIDEKAFTLEAVEKLLVQKLNFVLMAQRCTKDFEEICLLDDVLANEQHDAVRGKHTPKASFTTKTARRFMRRKKNVRYHGDVELDLEGAAKHTRARRTFDTLREKFAYFDVLYADDTMTSVVHSVVEILGYLHDIKQMLRLSRCWNYVVNAKTAMTERAYFQDMTDLEVYVPRLQLGGFLEKLYDRFEPTEAVPKYIEAVFSATLYGDNDLRRKSFELLDRQLSLVRDGQHLFDQMHLVSKGHKAFLFRLSTVYEEQLLVHVHAVVAQPDPTNAYVLERLTFAIENLRALHFSTFLDRLDATRSDEDRRNYIRRTSTTVKREAKKLNIDANHFLPDGKPEQDCMTYLMRPIPCPTGPEDFFELEMERLVMEEGAIKELAEHFDLVRQTVTLSMPEAVIDCEVTMARLGSELIETMLQLTRAPLFFPWHALFVSEKFLLDQLLSFLAEVGHNSAPLMNEWFPQLSEMLITYFPESIGCGKMAISILRRCRSAHTGKDTFSRQILRSVVHHGLVGTALCSSLLVAILQCDDASAATFAAGFMLSRIQDFTSTFNFRTEPSEMLDNDLLRTQLHNILHPLSLCFNKRVTLPESVSSVLKVPLSPEFCKAYLSSESVPLYLKACISQIAVWLYPFEVVSIEVYLLAELRSMRRAFNLDIGLDVEKSVAFSRDFVCQGLLPVLKKRIIDSNLFTKLAINTAVVKVIDDVESKDIRNISIGKLVTEKFRASFPTKIPTSTSKSKSSAGTPPRSSPAELLDDDEDNAGDLSKSFLDLSVFQCVMVLLNVLRLKYGAMSNILSPAQKADLIFVCTAALMVLSQYPERVVDPLIGEGLRSADFGAMMERLNEIVYGMVTEYIAVGVEKHISSFYETRLIDAAKSQFRTAALAAPEKLVRSKAPIFDLQQCFVNESEVDEKSRFSSAMNLAVVFPVEYLLHTPMYKFLATCIEKAASFIDLGGDMLFGDWRSPVIKSKSFASRFTQYTDFDLFLRGEGRYIECMFQYLGRVRQPTDAEYNLLHLLSALLLHKIESIRHSQFLSLNIRLMLVDSETKRLRRLQMTLNNLGAQSFLNIALGNIYNAHTGEPYMWLYAPLVLSFTNEVISWGNRESQDSIMDTISFNISKNKPPEMNALLGLRTLIRRCYLEIAYCTAEASSADSNRTKAGFPDSEHTKILRLVKQLFTFVGTFCKGDNVHAQRFFSAQLGSSKQYVNLVLELCLLTNSILAKFTSMMVYIKSDVFYERLAPLVWDAKDGTKRRFLAWHDPSNNIMLFSQYMYTIAHMLDGLLSMCCEGTAGSVQQALNKCPEILEFGGLLQLDATSRVQGRSFTGVSAGKQVVHWHGGKPFQFYRTYVSMLFASEVGESGSENDLMVTTLKKWTRGGRNRSFLGHHFGSNFDFLKIFGISFSHFEELARQMEEKCLSTMLAYFEVAPIPSCTEMSSKFNDGMLMQNMNSTFQKIFSGGTAENDKYASTAVAYVSVLESMGHFFPETQELLAEWAESSLRQGNDPKKVFGVVEIVGKSGRLQRLYFPVPTFVSRFWPYPEVQKMKDLIVMTVNRQSPEEKLVDYLQQMVRITTVMKRQERLRSVLTFPLHAFFGGKTTTFSSYLPNQRMLALLLTLVLNVYYCYFTSLGVRFEPHAGSALNHWTNWSGMERTMIIVKAVHLGLNGSQTLSRVLNSEVTDELFQTYKQDALVPDLLVKLALLPVAICYLIQDTFWPLCMLTFSFFALYANKFWLYVPCLFDVAFQFTFMNFLYVAVALNAGKIWYTLVLAFLCLYFYSVIATLYFTGQYSLDDHSGCQNIVACFKLHLDYGLYNVPNWDNDGYISPVLPLPFVYGTLLARAIGTMYNVSYVILINLVLQSIISGLIIDTFSKLREENESVLQDIYDKCFICSINRDEFEQAGIPFRQHIHEQHNMWHYVWFKIYLESKDPLTYSSSETHSAEKMNVAQDFLRLIPIKKSLSLIQKKGEDEPDAQLEEKLDVLLASMSKIQTANTKLGKSIVMLRRANARIEVKVNEKSTDKGET